MTTQTEALKLALEALEYYDKPLKEYSAKTAKDKDFKAIAAIKEALANHIEDNLAMVAQPEQEPVAKKMTAHRAAYFMERFKHEEKLLGPNEQAALDFVISMLEAQSEQEPVAWMHWLRGPVRVFLNKDEAMMELERLNRDYASDKDSRMMRPLVFGDTNPPQRKPLTDEQIAKCMISVEDPIQWGKLGAGCEQMVIQFARAIEAAHGIKE